MPVSSPSYFPPQRNIDRIIGLNAGLGQTGNRVFMAGFEAGDYAQSSDLIVIGSSALNGITSGEGDSIQGAVIIGSQSAGSLYRQWSGGTTTTTDNPVIIGYGNLPNTVSADGSVIIGTNNFGQLRANTVTYQGINQSIVIGGQILNGTAALTNATSGIQNSIVLGWNIYHDNTYWDGMGNAVLIGANIGNSAYSTTLSNCVVIGAGACAYGIPSSLVAIGTAVLSGQHLVHGAVGNFSVFIGDGAGNNVGVSGLGDGCVMIGYSAGDGFNDHDGWTLIGSSGSSGGTPFAAWGSPLSTGGANVALCGATGSYSGCELASAKNTVFLFNGSAATVNPTGGGYFYINAGALHWVGSNGTDTEIAPA